MELLGEFQFTPLREGRPVVLNIAVPTSDFNSRPSARGDVGKVLSGVQSVISIHAPPRGATKELQALMQMHAYFNSRPSARGDDTSVERVSDSMKISIHAPPRGATDLFGDVTKMVQFQFTPLREGRHGRNERLHPVQDFNSRPSARGDADGVHVGDLYYISIHAPPRGATRGAVMFSRFS